MSQKQSQRSLVRRKLRKHGYLRHQELCDAGVSPSTIKRMVEEGELRKISRGLFQLEDADWEMHHNYASVAKKIPDGVVCLLSVLSHYNLTDWFAPKVWLAVRKDTWVPKDYQSEIFVHRFSEKMISTCVDTIMVEGVNVKIFSVPKTVADCFRHKKYVGIDVALEGLENGLRENYFTAEEITEYAKQFGSWSAMQPYLDAIVSKISFEGNQNIF